MKKICALLAVLAMASAASAAPVFCDDFESYTPGLNWNGGGVWAISDGTVDLIGVGTSWNYFPANGKYIDLDGTTGDAGIMTKSFDLAAGMYKVSFELAGSQRGGSDSANVEVNFGTLWSDQYTLSSTDPFQKYEQVINVAQAVQGASLSFGGVGGDNVGLLLDNVCIEAVSVVPAPGALLLGSLGAGLVGAIRRRMS